MRTNKALLSSRVLRLIPCLLATAATLTSVCNSPAQTPRRGIDDLRANRSGEASRPSTRDNAPQSDSSASGFRVESFTPLGRARMDDSITLQFTSPLPDNLQPSQLAGLVSFDPALEVDASLESPKKVRLTPRRPLRNATTYKARINPLVKDSAGKTIGGTTQFEFYTDGLEVTSAGQTDFSEGRTVSIALAFNQAVSPVELRKNLSVNSGGVGLKYDLVPNQAASSFRVIVRSIPEEVENVSLRVQAGLRGNVGPRALTQTVDRRVRVRFQVTATEAEADWNGDEPRILVSFNTSIAGEPKDKISITPSVPFTISNQGYRLILTGAFKPNQRYTVQLAPGIKASNGSQLQEQAQVSAFVPVMPPFLSTKNAGGYLSLQGRMKMTVRHQGYPTIRLRVWRLFDSNIPVYLGHGDSDWSFTDYARRVASRDITVDNPTETGVTEIDLTKELGNAEAGYYRFELVGMGANGKEESGDYDSSLGRVRGRETVRISLTNLAVIAKSGPDSLAVWVASLSDSKPVANAEVEVFSAKYQPVGRGRTDATGMVIIKNPAFGSDQKPAVVQVVSGQDRSFLDVTNTVSVSESNATAEGRPFLAQGLEAFVTPDRGAYRPGEDIRIFGLVRDRTGAAPSQSVPLKLSLTGPDGRVLPAKTIQVSGDSGFFETTVSISSAAPTGLWRASLRLPKDATREWMEGNDSEESEYSESSDEDIRPEDLQNASNLGRDELGAADFFVEEFVPNRLKVTASAPEGRLRAVDPIAVSVRAEEMFGASAGERPFEGRAILRPEPFSPTGYDDFVFGNSERKFTRQEISISEETLNSDGQGQATIELPSTPPPASLKATILLTVKDIGGRGVTSRIERVVDPVPFYLGARRPAKGFLPVGESSVIELAALTPQGQPASEDTEVSATIYQVRWNSLLKSEDGRFSYEVTRELNPVATETIRIAGGKGQLKFEPKSSGSYLIIADATPSVGTIKPSVSLSLYASTGQWQDEAWSMERPEKVDIVPDQERYEIGDKAKVLIKAPFPGTLLLTLEQDGVLRHEVRTMASNTEEIEIPVEDAHLPNVYVSATVLRPVRPSGRWLPHRALGVAALTVNPVSRKLAITPELPTEARPGTAARISLAVAESATSKPVANIPVTVWAVDEGILSLTDFRTPDPHNFFYGRRRLGVRQSDYMGQLMPDIDPAKAASAPGGGEAGQRGFVSPVAADRVKPVAIWLGTLRSGPDGKVSGELPIPNFIGRLRLMAVAASGPRFGSGEGELLVRNPVMIREGLPRFASPGDQLFIPVTAYNNTTDFATMAVRIAASGPAQPIPVGRWLDKGTGTIEIETTATAGKSSTRIAEIQIPREAGVARFQIGASLGIDSYQESVEVPVRPASPMIRRSGVIEVAPGSSADIPLGGDYLPGTAQVNISAGSMPMLAFAPALLELLRQPFGCSEQIAAGAFPLIYLPELAQAVDPDRLHKDGTTARVQQAVDRLCLMQTSEGGFAVWPGGTESEPYNSVFVTHFLLEAKTAGFEVPESAIQEGVGYCKELLTDTLDEDDQSLIRSYATLVLALAGTPERGSMESLSDKLPTTGNEARAILASAFVRAKLVDRARELLRGEVAAVQSRSSSGAFSSPIRESALLLSAWLDVDPKAPEVARLAQRLSTKTNKRGHFGTTQDNAFALFALGKLAKAVNSDKPTSGEIRAEGLQPVSFANRQPVSILANSLAGTTPTVTVNAGGGSAYVFYSIEGVPLVLPAEETTVTQGIQVTRRYLKQNGTPVLPRKLDQGQMLIVELEFSGIGAIDNLAVVDLLPAGFEIENPNLVTSSADSSDSNEEGAITVERTEVRDDRYIAFINLIDTKKPRKLRYAVRCVTAGTFNHAPVQVMAMYDPDIVARSGAGVVSINPKRNVTPANLP